MKGEKMETLKTKMENIAKLAMNRIEMAKHFYYIKPERPMSLTEETLFVSMETLYPEMNEDLVYEYFKEYM
jgi:hypothetical protein